MSYARCPGSLWFRSLEGRGSSLDEKVYITPLVGRLAIVNWASMSHYGEFDGIVAVESELSEASMTSMWNLARTLSGKSRTLLQSWLQALWAFSQVDPQQGLPEWSDLEGSVNLFLSYPKGGQKAILDAVGQLLDIEKKDIRMATYTGREAFRPLTIARMTRFLLEKGSQAHVTAVTHEKHGAEASKEAKKIFEKMVEVVKEGEEADEVEGRIVTPDYGGVDPLTLSAILGIAKDAEVVDNAIQAADRILAEQWAISGC